MWYETLLEKNVVPDGLIRIGIRKRLARKLQEESEGGDAAVQERRNQLIRELRQSPIAIETQLANEQHYELPSDFFQLVLGRRLKYSSGLWERGVSNLNDSEEAMLERYVDRAQIQDGQKILDLGCGWGSLSMFLAERFPNSEIVSVSNSSQQKAFIDECANSKGLKNVRVVTCDMNQLEMDQKFDRILSIEMFEHMRNYEKLFEKISGWLKPDALLFVHIFCHKQYAYPYVAEGPNDWMARYFFSGGMMPSQDLFESFHRDLEIVRTWEVNGTHYQKTCEAWLQEMDSKQESVMRLFHETYGRHESQKWWSYWRIFFMACAELFGYAKGREWFVSHYLFRGCQ